MANFHTEETDHLFQALLTLQSVEECYRYFEDLTQSKIAEMMGVSQMQVSRLEKSALEKIRGLMKVADD